MIHSAYHLTCDACHRDSPRIEEDLDTALDIIYRAGWYTRDESYDFCPTCAAAQQPRGRLRVVHRIAEDSLDTPDARTEEKPA